MTLLLLSYPVLRYIPDNFSLFLSNKMNDFCCAYKPRNNKDRLLCFPVILPALALRKEKHKRCRESFPLNCKD